MRDYYLNGFGALGYPAGTKETAQVTWLHSQAQAASYAASGQNPPDWVIKDFVNHNASLPQPSTNPADSKALRLKEAGFVRAAAMEPPWGGNADDLAYATKVEALINAGGDFTATTNIDQALANVRAPIPAPSVTSIVTPAAIAAAGGASNIATPGTGTALSTSSWPLYAALGGGSLLFIAIMAKVAKKRHAKKAAAAGSSMTLSGLGNRASRCHMKATTMKQHRACYR